MSSSDPSPQPAIQTTEITLSTGDRHRVEGDTKHVERIIAERLAVRSCSSHGSPRLKRERT
jgi:hypothetical protein